MPPTQVDVIFPLPEGWGICLTCEAMMAHANMGKAPYERGLDEYPAEWQEEFRRFSDHVLDLSARYGNAILIRIFDPRSLQGLWKSIRYGVRHYPTFIVNGREKVTGWDAARIKSALKAAGAVEKFAVSVIQ